MWFEALNQLKYSWAATAQLQQPQFDSEKDRNPIKKMMLPPPIRQLVNAM